MRLKYLALALLGVPFLAAYLLTRRRTPGMVSSPLAYGMQFETVQFLARDGVMLQGWWIPMAASATSKPIAAPTVVQCAGQNGSMDDDLPTAYMLHKSGYNVLMFDYRAHGASADEHVTFGLAEAHDLHGALDFLETKKGIARVGVLAFSMGVLVTLNVAHNDPRIQVAVCDGVTGPLSTTLTQWLVQHHVPRLLADGFARLVVWLAAQRTGTPLYTIDGVTLASRLQTLPVLYVHGAQDHLIAMADLYRLRHNLSAAALWVVPNCGHREAFVRYPERYEARVLAWFDRHLRNAMV